MRQRQGLADMLRPAGHAAEREHEARQQHRGQKEEEGQLQRLQLVAGQRREGEAHAEIGQHEDADHRQQQHRAAHHRHLEQQEGGTQDDGQLQIAQQHIGQDLADHHLERPHRCGQQVFHRAALTLAGHGQRSQHDHGHGQDGADQAGHDVVAGQSFGVVAALDAHLERRGAWGQRGERPAQLAVQRGLCKLVQRGNGVARSRGVGGIGRDQQRRPFAAHDAGAEVVGHDDQELNVAALQQRVAARFRNAAFDDAEIAAGLQRRDDAARHWAGVLADDRGRQALGVGVDRVAEQHQLQHRHAHRHREGQAVAQHLLHLLECNREGAGDGKHQAAAEKLSVAWPTSRTKASSRSRAPASATMAAAVPRASTWP
mmetsp:Transcript_23364/g.55522  ORF Transcript_23364/g.55522 Transcript_23364/m.55522 type:complete len:372 (+) Transcript_23364:433-1548(+)